jgi:hypothetical protein
MFEGAISADTAPSFIFHPLHEFVVQRFLNRYLAHTETTANPIRGVTTTAVLRFAEKEAAPDTASGAALFKTITVGFSLPSVQWFASCRNSPETRARPVCHLF